MDEPGHQSSQDAVSVAKNRSFFEANDDYAQNVATMTTYLNIRAVIDRSITGRRRLLDVGNGGVFDYDAALVPEIVGVDLFRDEDLVGQLAPNITLREGDALDLPEVDASFDGVLCVFLFHHLVARDSDGTLANIRLAVAEARRVLEPGGRLIVVESCVPPWAFSVERRLFGMLRVLAGTRLMRHPPTLQFPAESIADVLGEYFADVRVARIPVGRLILQFGHRWPVALTPARPYLFTAS